MKRVHPTKPILYRKPGEYKPSWTHEPRTTWTDRLGGHYGPVVPALRKEMK